MYSRKTAGSRKEPSGTPAFAGYSYDGFPSKTTGNCLLLRKGEIR